MNPTLSPSIVVHWAFVVHNVHPTFLLLSLRVSPTGADRYSCDSNMTNTVPMTNKVARAGRRLPMRSIPDRTRAARFGTELFTLRLLRNATEITSQTGLPYRPSSVLRQQLHSPAMRLLSRLEYER